MSTTVYIISAPSGSGKSTLVNKLRKIVSGLDFSVSYTTRRPRGSEQNGREYFFVPREEFDEMLRRGEFLESADVFGNCYGTCKRFLDEARGRGHDLLLDIDVQGAEQIEKKIPDAVSIFILPPDRKTLELRLRRRGLDDDEVIERRLFEARKEIENYWKYDYILVNDRLEESIDELKDVVLAERYRRSPAKLSPEELETIKRADGCRLKNVADRVRPILASFALATPLGH